MIGKNTIVFLFIMYFIVPKNIVAKIDSNEKKNEVQFSSIDKNGDDAITLTELNQSVGNNTISETTFKKYDTNCDNKLDENEYNQLKETEELIEIILFDTALGY
ncbi:uncharacterized protein LOC126902905 isoform X2 [Daktulosphaira vitifoliae]|uniref:uncharacterized protein LOC126902905 isoform X2 n=1 Tax=Daktulosphaira vitifoliae TaxID=58002 RepID=UPI0021AAB2E9|nr:uncharacterized protein LOC126902905 isoform X2 [Daktulosphaira vitifoliae]